MARPLALIAIGGLAISAVCFSLASSLAPADADIFHFPFQHDFSWNVIFDRSCSDAGETGPASTATSRDFAWHGGDEVEIDVPADVHYQPGTGTMVTVRGDPETSRHVQVHDSEIRFDCRWSGNREALDITLPGRDMRSFALNGSGRLFLDNLKQDSLKVAIAGSGDVRANGEAGRLDLAIAGSGNAHMATLVVKRARAVIAGSGNADIAPQDDADVVIAGSGNVRFFKQPKSLSSKILGSGRIISAPAQNSAPI